MTCAKRNARAIDRVTVDRLTKKTRTRAREHQAKNTMAKKSSTINECGRGCLGGGGGAYKDFRFGASRPAGRSTEIHLALGKKGGIVRGRVGRGGGQGGE